MSFMIQNKPNTEQKNRKKPPPRPPPPNFSRYKSKSSFNLNLQKDNLIEWSPPDSPKVERTHTNFGGSVSSSFSSSTSSLASSKKSLECDNVLTNNLWPINLNSYDKQNNSSYNKSKSTFFVPSETIGKEKTSYNTVIQSTPQDYYSTNRVNVPSIFGPTIIRPHNKIESKLKLPRGETFVSNDPSPSELPMPSVPPPSPPKESVDVNVAYGIALYDYPSTNPSDLSFQTGDVIVLIRRINNEWYYGKIMNKEGMFPANFIEVQVPLIENNGDNTTVMALYDFAPQMAGDLTLKPGQFVKVIRKVNSDWLYGESNGQYGQFPAIFVDRVPYL